MQENVRKAILAWFAENANSCDYGCCDRAHPFSVIGGSGTNGRIIFTTKPAVVSLVIHRSNPEMELGMIGRCGLPSEGDLEWIRQLTAGKELLFLGDMDPLDLLNFAWYRAVMYPLHIRFLGVNDELLRYANVPEAYYLPFEPVEYECFKLVMDLIPDVTDLVGQQCDGVLQRGTKVELDGIGTQPLIPHGIEELVGPVNPGSRCST